MSQLPMIPERVAEGPRHTPVLAVFAATTFLSSLLLFMIQPILARKILPVYGGAASVWVTCMVFFQVLLLAGYSYAHVLSRIPGRIAGLVHGLVVAAASLTIAFGWLTAPVKVYSGEPVGAILRTLGGTVGLACFALSATSPLVQTWVARLLPKAKPYRLFALSNLASMLALVAYPVTFELWLKLASQIRWWQIGFVVFAVLMLASLRHAFQTVVPPAAERAAIPLADIVAWVALAFCPAVLWIALANHLSQSVAAIPFLWVLPLALYLLTFALVFDTDRVYSRQVMRWLLIPALIALGCSLFPSNVPWSITTTITSALFGMFIVTLFCHGELARRRPPVGNLTAFYLWVATAGALGSLFVGVVAPLLFDDYVELPFAVVLAVILLLLYGGQPITRLQLVKAGLLGAAVLVAYQIKSPQEILGVTRVRNFYAALRVSEDGSFDRAYKSLFNGKIYHGGEWQDRRKWRMPTAYYGPPSGIGVLLGGERRHPLRVGLIGLGTGTIAAYAQPGDYFRFYEINPVVIDIAKQHFHYLSSAPAPVDIAEGDARLTLASESPENFDVLAVDAFSGDAIPIHLLTTEAFDLYRRHLKAGGKIAVHISNKFLDLGPVVARESERIGLSTVNCTNPAEAETRVAESRWIVAGVSELHGCKPFPAPASAPLWTDDFHNLIQVLR